MDFKKLIKKIEAAKVLLAGIRKDVEVEKKRIEKLTKKAEKTHEKLANKIKAIDATLSLVPGPDGKLPELPPKAAAQKAKLQAQQAALLHYSETFIGDGDDSCEDTVMGGIATAQWALDEIVKKEKGKLVGTLVGYQESLAEDEKPRTDE